MKEIAAIVNSADMYEKTMSVLCDYMNNIHLVLTKTYDESVYWAKRFETEGYRLIISRGGHAARIRENDVGIPLVEIPFIGQNMAGALMRAAAHAPVIAVIGNTIMVETAEQFASALGLEIKCYQIDGWNDFERKIQAAQNDGLHIIVGGYDVSSFAAKLGMKCICVETTDAEIKIAYQEALKMLDLLNNERQWNELFRVIMDSIQDGIISVDDQGLVTHVNIPAQRLLGCGAQQQLGKLIAMPVLKEKIEKTLRGGAGSFGVLCEVNNVQFSGNVQPIIVGKKITGSVVVLQEIEYVQKMEQKIRRQLYQRGFVARYTFEKMIGGSLPMKNAIKKAKQYSLTNSTILITGESGVGKELFAQSIHNLSNRRSEAFVAVNCATLPANLLESELFGYAEGAFTGAKKGGKSGLFELAHNGTVFLDEIGEISLEMQARLLRVLEERQVMRIGDERVIPVNIRIIAATNKNLRQMVQKGLFREDFYYRLNVLSLQLPSLRERREDIPLLVDNFLQIYAAENQRLIPNLSADCMPLLCNYDWPGNIREMKNVIERLVITHSDDVLVEAHEVYSILYDSHTDTEQYSPSSPGAVQENADNPQDDRMMNHVERELIDRVLRECNGNKTLAAKRLGIGRATLYRKLPL